MAASFPDEEAYKVLDSGALTFARWDAMANRLARGLVSIGLQPGDRVAIHLAPENALRWLVAYPAVHRAGGVAVPLNPRLGSLELGNMLAHAGVRIAVADGERVALDRLAGMDRHAASGRGRGAPARTVIDASHTPAGRAAPSHHGSRGRMRPDGAVLAWDAVLDEDGSGIQVPRDEGDLADILYTSGTTGSPKGVAIRFANASLIPGDHATWNGGRWLTASPMFTFAGIAFVYNPMKLGMGCLYQPRFDTGRWLDVVEAERPTAVFLVPAMANLLLAYPRFNDADLTSIQICSVGSAPLAPFVVERLQERMPDALVSNNYGMTEAGSAYCLMPKGEAVRRPGAVGIPAPPAEVRCVDENGDEVPAGEVGEVRLRLPGRPREYYGDPEATKATWVDGWLRTGDLGRIDEDGYLYIVGRAKDVIIRGGHNVHATDVEHVIASHPDVLEAAVVGVPHDVLGEDVVAFVVLRQGPGPGPGRGRGRRQELGQGRRPDGDALRAYCLERLADYKVPRRWHFVEALPRNATGKVVKSELLRTLDAMAAQ